MRHDYHCGNIPARVALHQDRLGSLYRVMVPLALGVYRDPNAARGLRLAAIPPSHYIFRMDYSGGLRSVRVLLGSGDLGLAKPKLHCGKGDYDGWNHQVSTQPCLAQSNGKAK
jgi:hypothetical protein